MSVFCPAATSSRLSTVAVLSTLLSLAACADEVSEPGAAEELGFVFSSFGFHYPTGGEVLGFDLLGGVFTPLPRPPLLSLDPLDHWISLKPLSAGSPGMPCRPHSG